ncbi:hypothetical protein CAPTEDRAFT_198576 [Capitella teleta]|uniref:Uncharacterized protein n=1 Tax=Capitella teleta TaxID=283909 RepID=R7VCH2_CAPTE|nr:hypothetical protein CAPTEDRAFT_198576 [Capitella teleta]|eukprot:ELU13385.1 hypothetical protein CAPTEDRAFT_198576 [Capitella teleta]
MPMLVSINIAHLAEIRLYVYQLDENSSLQFYENEDGELTVDNDLYTGSRPHQSEENGELYAEVGSNTKKPKSKKKKFALKPGPDDIYAQIDKAKKSNMQDEDGELTVDNDLYTGSRPHQSEENGELYAEVGSNTKKPKSKKKKFALKPGPDDIYAQIDKTKKSNMQETHHDESIYQNCGQPDEEIYANADHANQFVTDDGVVYIEVEFGAESDSNVIRGVVEDVEYAQIDLTKI